MEEKLKAVQMLMELDRQKRTTTDSNGKEGATLWRSATQN
jgi:hypothetical protein